MSRRPLRFKFLRRKSSPRYFQSISSKSRTFLLITSEWSCLGFRDVFQFKPESKSTSVHILRNIRRQSDLLHRDVFSKEFLR
ncbi:unnamed protein product [Moneuplotes crassus]|uniref:Uncharacterized protein n=1 Tax=Euplotes crassus TaxID=5936 RepID=A0AAD1UF83_EUPCR|nr:unnamed protein product [Moneuplotes crassus]